MQDLENDGPRMRWMPTYTALNTTGSSTVGVYPCVVKCDNKQVEVDKVWLMHTGSSIVLRLGGRIRNAAFLTMCRSSPALRDMAMAHTPGCSFCRQSASLGAYKTEAFQVTSEDDSDREDDASSHESVVNSTPPAIAIATSTVTAVAASNDVCEVCFIEPRDKVALVPCGHCLFCSSCADAVASMPMGCPICRMPIASVLHVFI